MSGEITAEQLDTLASLVADRLRPDPYLSKQELADHFRCSVRSIEHAVAAGMPHTIAFGRPKFQLSKVEPWLVDNGYVVVGDSSKKNGAAVAGNDPAPGHGG